MLTATILFFFLIFVLSIITSRRNIFSPAVITSGIWFFILILFQFIDHKLNPLTPKFLIAIDLWVFFFCISSMFVQSIHFSNKHTFKPSQLARNILFYFSLITLPLFLFTVHDILQSASGGNWTIILRKIAIGGMKNIEAKETSPFYVVFWLVSLLIELYYYSSANKKKVIILLIINIIYAFVSMSKTNFLSLFLSITLLLYFKNTIKTKHIILGITILSVFLYGFQEFRSNNSSSSKKGSITGFITLYMLSNPPAFETVKPNSTINSGENTFRIYYAIKNKLGLTKTKPVDQILPFTNVPISTNTYTTLYPYYKDYGKTGIIVFAILLGLIFGYVFKKSQESNVFFIIILAFIIPQLVMQFAGEMIFTNLTLNIKRIIIVLIPFFISKYNLFSKSKNSITTNE